MPTAAASLRHVPNTLDESVRETVAPILQGALADATDLYSQVKQAHWNVRGANFIALHELFDQVAGSVLGHVDEIAERLVMLGGLPHGTVRAAASTSRLEEYPLDATDAARHVEALTAALSAFGTTVREAIDTTADAGDADTADLFTQVSRDIDKWLWFVEAHRG